jgi:hypothetical protein
MLLPFGVAVMASRTSSEGRAHLHRLAHPPRQSVPTSEPAVRQSRPELQHMLTLMDRIPALNHQ